MENMVALESIYNGKTVFITGHTGFKGSWLSIWLNLLGAKVVGYALKPPTEPSLFKTCNLQKRLISIEGDVRDFEYLKENIVKHKPEIVFHMAAQSLVRLSYQDPLLTYSTNVMGTVNLLEAIRQTKTVKAVIIVTSDKCYENKDGTWSYKESDPMGGHDPYSSSKGCAELVTKAYLNTYFNPDNFKENGVSLASVRAGNVIGGGDWAKDRLIPDCIKACSSKRPIIIRYPNAVRPWQHVLEPLLGYLLLAKSLYEHGCKHAGAWNFGPNDEDSKPVKWLVEKIIEIWKENASWENDSSFNPYEASSLRLDCFKANSELGWSPVWDLNTALQKTVEWFKAYIKNEEMLDFTISQIQAYEKAMQKAKNELQIL